MVLLEFMCNWAEMIAPTSPIMAIDPVTALLIAGGLSAAGSLGAAGISANASKKANQKSENLLAEQQNKNELWWESKKNENYLDSAEAQAAINKAREMAQEQMSYARGVNAVMGGTDAGIAAAQQNANKMLADTISGAAATSTARKDAAELTYLNRNNDLAQQVIAGYAQKAANNAAAGSSAMSALGSIGSSLIKAFGGAKA